MYSGVNFYFIFVWLSTIILGLRIHTADWLSPAEADRTYTSRVSWPSVFTVCTVCPPFYRNYSSSLLSSACVRPLPLSYLFTLFLCSFSLPWPWREDQTKCVGVGLFQRPQPEKRHCLLDAMQNEKMKLAAGGRGWRTCSKSNSTLQKTLYKGDYYLQRWCVSWSVPALYPVF